MFKGFQKPKRLVANTDTLTELYGMFTVVLELLELGRVI